jgi:hypothetical protein
VAKEKRLMGLSSRAGAAADLLSFESAAQNPAQQASEQPRNDEKSALDQNEKGPESSSLSDPRLCLHGE